MTPPLVEMTSGGVSYPLRQAAPQSPPVVRAPTASRTATVRTRQECSLLRINGQEFLSALQGSRPSASLLAVAETRMARAKLSALARFACEIIQPAAPRTAAP